jgi:hypothetical protein
VREWAVHEGYLWIERKRPSPEAVVIAKLIFYTMSAEVVHSRLVAVLKTA